MNNLKPTHEIYLVAFIIIIQVILGGFISPLIPEYWIIRYKICWIILAFAQVLSLTFYFLNKYYD